MFLEKTLKDENYERIIGQIIKKDNLDLVAFKNFGGNYTEGIGYSTYLVYASPDEGKDDQILYQPEIKNNFFQTGKEHDLLSGIVYDKLYRRDLIRKMSRFMGKDFWEMNLSYFEDYIIIMAAAREARSFKLMSGIGGIWHWYNNPNGATAGFEVIGGKLLREESANKKMSDNLYVIEKVFDIFEEDRNAGVLVAAGIYLMGKSMQQRQVLAACSSYKRFIELIDRYYNWQYKSETYMTDLGKMAFVVMALRNDNTLLTQYSYFYEGKEWYDEWKKNNNPGGNSHKGDL